MDPKAGTAAPNTPSLEGSFRCESSRDATGQEMTVKMPRSFLLANDQRPNPSPDVSVKPTKSPDPLLGAKPKVPEPAPQVTVHFLDAGGDGLAPRPRRKLPDASIQPFIRPRRGCNRHLSSRGFPQMEAEKG